MGCELLQYSCKSESLRLKVPKECSEWSKCVRRLGWTQSGECTFAWKACCFALVSPRVEKRKANQTVTPWFRGLWPELVGCTKAVVKGWAWHQGRPGQYTDSAWFTALSRTKLLTCIYEMFVGGTLQRRLMERLSSDCLPQIAVSQSTSDVEEERWMSWNSLLLSYFLTSLAFCLFKHESLSLSLCLLLTLSFSLCRVSSRRAWIIILIWKGHLWLVHNILCICTVAMRVTNPFSSSETRPYLPCNPPPPREFYLLHFADMVMRYCNTLLIERLLILHFRPLNIPD